MPREGLLGIDALTRDEIQAILDRARDFQPKPNESFGRFEILKGRTVVNLFFETSTRTRTSFEIAAKRLGADAVSITAQASSVTKGESLVDTLNTLAAMRPDAIVMRHSASGAPHFLQRYLATPIVNAGDGTHEHPTQGLLDALTIRDRRGQLDGCKITIIGDILHSRVARSNIHLLAKFGALITLCGPAMWLPRELECLAPNVRRVPVLEDALDGADVIMALRIQQERIHEPSLPADEYILRYQLTPARLRLARPDAIVLHPGPMIRGLEIDPAVADSSQSCVLEQVTNGLAIRMAILFELVAGSSDPQEHVKDSAHASD